MYIFIVTKNGDLVTANTKKWAMMRYQKDTILNDPDIKVVRVREGYGGSNDIKDVTIELVDEIKAGKWD